MLEIARGRGLPSNVRLAHTSGADLPLPDGSFDLVMSLLVLQHIPDQRILLANLREIRRVTNATGRAILQFDSRGPSAVVAIVQALPDALLPRIRRRYFRRYRRPSHAIDALLREAGLTILRETGRGTATHHLALSPASR